MPDQHILYDRSPERHERQFCDLKELLAKRNPNDRQAPQAADHNVPYCHRYSRHKQPDNICYEAHRSAPVYDLLPKGTERKTGKFEALYPDGYADNRHTP